MAESSRSQVTITLGRSGQVVKRAGHVSDSSFSNSEPAVGSKRSVRDRLGSNVDSTTQFQNKRLRADGSRLSLIDRNGTNENSLAKDDLRFKIMQKNILNRGQSSGQQSGMDLRDLLSRSAQSSTTYLSTRQHIPEAKTTSQHLMEPRDGKRQIISESRDFRQLAHEHRDPRQHMRELKDARHPMTDPRSSSMLGPVPPSRSLDAVPQMDSLRTSYSPWTLDRLKRRSPDRVLSISRGLSPTRREEDMQRRTQIRAYSDTRAVSYISKDALQFSRPVASSSYMSSAATSVGRMKPTASLLPPQHTSGSLVQKSSYTADVQPTIDSFLHSLGLDKYAIDFKAQEVDMYVLRQMSDNDLKELGIPMGPRKKILLALLASHTKRSV